MSTPDWIFRPGLRGQREYEAHHLSRHLAANVVPYTVLTTTGSVQLILPYPTVWDATPQQLDIARTPVGVSDIAALTVLNLLLGNEDCHGRNLLVSPYGRMYGIDWEDQSPQPITLSKALIPVYLLDVVDDTTLTPLLLRQLELLLQHAGDRQLAQRVYIEQWQSEIEEWRSVLRGLWTMGVVSYG